MRDRRFQGTVLIALALCASLFVCNSNRAEKRTLTIYGTVHVYPSHTPPAAYPGTDFIAVIGPKDHVKVVEVIQKREHMVVRVRLSDGREGWVFSGESIELYEPGCRGPDFRSC